MGITEMASDPKSDKTFFYFEVSLIDSTKEAELLNRKTYYGIDIKISEFLPSNDPATDSGTPDTTAISRIDVGSVGKDTSFPHVHSLKAPQEPVKLWR
jgi:hypothetical protein